MTVLGGKVTRPPGSDWYWPPVGTSVEWTAVKPIQDLMDQDLMYPEFNNLGVIGNLAHLQKHGGHTPWRPGSVRGKVYAKDTQCPPDFTPWFLAKCRSDYDTTWIRFFNLENRQYDHGGTDLGYSADHHFHVEVHNGFENKSVTLFTDFMKERRGDVMNADQDKRLVRVENAVLALQNMILNGVSPTGVETTGGNQDRIYLFDHLDKDREAVKKAITEQITTMKADMSKQVTAAVASAVSDLGLSDAQVDKIASQVITAVNKPLSGTWTVDTTP